jgi:PQQ-dependent dehydrogenase (methanol/ethanol family)
MHSHFGRFGRAARRAARWTAAAALALLSLAPRAAAQHAHPPADEWPSYGRDYTNQRFSPLRGITAGNVTRLVPRRVFQTGTAQLNGLIGSPLVAGGVLYMTTPFNSLIAWDLRSGRERWRYEHKLGTYIPCCGPTNRGAALADGLVFMATLDAHLVALDAATGAVRWDVQDSDPDSAYSFTMAPLVVEGRVIVGTSGAEYPTRGRLTAYDTRTGARLWRWHAVPSPEEGGWWGVWSPTTPTGASLGRDIARERADSARYPDAWRLGGGAVWTTPAYDSATGLLYFGTGNPVPEYDGTVRPGDNLYTVSVVALEAATGRLRWYHQYIPHDLWDSDAANPPILLTDGTRSLVAHAGKTGYVYLLDAASGRLVRRSEPFVPLENVAAQPSAAGQRRAPGAAGGAEWSPSAYSPRTGLMYVRGLHAPMAFKTFHQDPAKGQDYRGGTEELAADEPTYSTVSAIDLRSGALAWEARTTPGQTGGGALVTAGNLVFAGDVNGWFHAYDARSGRELWNFFCGAGVYGPPIAYAIDGEQFVAVAAGGGFYEGHFGDAVIVFGLPPAGARRGAQR